MSLSTVSPVPALSSFVFPLVVLTVPRNSEVAFARTVHPVHPRPIPHDRYPPKTILIYHGI